MAFIGLPEVCSSTLPQAGISLAPSGSMRIGFLYEQAVELTPKAARMAAVALAADENMPASLRRSLYIALSACADPADASGASTLDAADAAAAQRFVAACREVARRISISQAPWAWRDDGDG